MCGDWIIFNIINIMDADALAPRQDVSIQYIGYVE